MKPICTFASILILTNLMAAQPLTMNDPNYATLSEVGASIGWYQVRETQAWDATDGAVDSSKRARCMAVLDKLRAAGVADSRSIEVRYDTPEFKAGNHTLAEVRKSCEHVERVGRIKAFEQSALVAMDLRQKPTAGSEALFEDCIQEYNRAIKAGASPQDRVADKLVRGKMWSGTIEELRKQWCDSGLKQANANAAAREAPYRKELKGDKLKIALTYGSFFLLGGESTSDPHKLAAAPVWFIDLSPSRICPDGRQVHTLRRYKFASEQQLVTTTEREYCGAAPRTAFQ